MTSPGNYSSIPCPPMQPLQQAIRFSLEIAALVAFGIAGWNASGNRAVASLLAILLPALGAAIWVVFRTPGDTSAGKPAVVPVPGTVRLLLELLFFGLATAAFWMLTTRAVAETFLTVLALHNFLTWERSRWLLTSAPD